MAFSNPQLLSFNVFTTLVFFLQQISLTIPEIYEMKRNFFLLCIFVLIERHEYGGAVFPIYKEKCEWRIGLHTSVECIPPSWHQQSWCCSRQISHSLRCVWLSSTLPSELLDDLFVTQRIGIELVWMECIPIAAVSRQGRTQLRESTRSKIGVSHS